MLFCLMKVIKSYTWGPHLSFTHFKDYIKWFIPIDSCIYTLKFAGK